MTSHSFPTRRSSDLLGNSGDKETKAHLQDSRDRISKILYPEKGK
jgi:hypothetical protein